MTSSLRIGKGFARREAVTFRFDDREIGAFAGESVAAALFAAGIVALGNSPVDGSARGPFCFMGVCQECIVELDGVATESCRLPVSAGLQVKQVR